MPYREPANLEPEQENVDEWAFKLYCLAYGHNANHRVITENGKPRFISCRVCKRVYDVDKPNPGFFEAIAIGQLIAQLSNKT